ncbi:hypothetical protein H6800_01220 [Candidatus Nomurabacteria bacterium]|nr:hypothetical protein [Candidatus Nomurabacteria bacterium]
MSRYLILILLNAPLIIAALLGNLVNFKLGKLSFRKYIGQTIIWIAILLGLVFAGPIYEFLFTNDLTQTEPLSLFDVVQITGIIVVLFMSNRSRIKLQNLEKRVQDLHQELSIRLSRDEKFIKK